MKKNKLVACIIIFTMLFTSGVGSLGALLNSYAQDKNNLIITDILNENPVPTLDDKCLLEQNIEKISDTQLKVNLKITGNNQDINMKNVSLINTLADNFEIISDSVLVSGIEDSDKTKGEVTSNKDTVTINLGDIFFKEINISFEAKIRANASSGENLPINLNAEIKYTLDESDKNISAKFPIPKVSLIEKVNESKIESFTIEKKVRKLLDKNAQDTITINQDEEFEVEIRVSGNETETSELNIIDYIDLTKFEYVANSASITGVKNIQSEVGSSTNEIKSIQYKSLVKETEDIIVKYKIKARTNISGVNSLSPSDSIGNIYDGDNIKYFSNISVTINEQTSDEKGILSITEEPEQPEELEQPVLNKTATNVGNRIFEIELTVKGAEITLQEQSEADIVIVLDNSISLQNNISQVQEAAKSLINQIFIGDLNNNIRVSIISFSKHNGPELGFTNKDSIAAIQNVIDDIYEGDLVYATDTQTAILNASKQLEVSEQNNPEAKRYVIMFTDGCPNTQDGKPASFQESYYKHFKAAQKAYYENFLHLSPTNGGKVNFSQIGLDAPKIAETMTIPNTEKRDAKFYTVGVITATDDRTNNWAKEFLKTIQNVIPQDQYASKYYTNNFDNLGTILEDIGKDINNEVNQNIVNNATITDIVAPEFIILENQYDLDGRKVTSIVETLPKPGDILRDAEITVDKENNTISWKVGNISKSGVSVKFRVKVKNDYFGSEEGIYTNTNATLDFEYPDGTDAELEFRKPEVSIPYKMGSITVTKEIFRKNNLGSYEKVEDGEVNINDRFSISLIGNQTYTVDLIGNQTERMDFYLRDGNTDISNNEDYTLNYFTVGNYSIKELIPMNYEQDEILIDTDPTTGENWVELEDSITIDKDNPHINIKVINKLENYNYWQDKADKINEFKYKYN